MIIETPRLALYEWKPDEAEVLHPIVSDPETMAFWPTPFTRERTEGWIARSLAHYAERGFGRWRVALKETGETIGDCGIIVAEVNGREENDLGYILHRNWWGRGLGLEAARACMEHGFESLGLARLVANMADNHTRSAHVADQLGMRLEGTFLNSRNRNFLTRLYAREKP